MIVTFLAVAMIIASLILTAVSWKTYGWNQSYWIVFGCTVFVAILLLIGEFV